MRKLSSLKDLWDMTSLVLFVTKFWEKEKIGQDWKCIQRSNDLIKPQ